MYDFEDGQIARWTRRNGYIFATPDEKGVVKHIYDEIAVYGKARVYTKYFGKTHAKSETFLLGYLRSFTSAKSVTSYNVVRLVRAGANGNNVFSDASLPLGGKMETLG